jgi:regulator of protease activity HflC (stomatin/prohibitin superfamily)
MVAGVPVWLMVALLFYTRQLEAREAAELEELASGRSGTVFEGERADEVRPAAQRRAWMERWVVPAFTLLWAGAHAVTGVFVLRALGQGERVDIESHLEGVAFLLLAGFPCFLLGWYAMGMARRQSWRLLRATGSYLLVAVLFVVLGIAALVAAYAGYGGLDGVLAYAAPVAQLILAVELILNFVLDIYRPRVPGQEHRPSFDSRLLNLAAEPGRVGHSIAEAVNYQFGFEVSKTWFYKLLQRAAVPLLIAGVAILLAMSCVVVVNEGEVYVLKRWGRVEYARGTLGPGMHVKWPWPVETAEAFETGLVHEVQLGAGQERTEEERQASFVKGRELFLWTEEHGRRWELDFLVAVPPESRGDVQTDEDKAPPVSILKLVVAVHYVIEDPYRYGYEFVNPHKLLECIGYQEMVRYCASATLTAEIEGEGVNRPEAILTHGREAAAERLRELIEDRLAKLDLGVRITYVGLLSTHPPAAAAPAFEEVLQAEREQDQKRYQAEGEANEILAAVAGSPARALMLALSINRAQQLENLRDRAGAPEELREKLSEYISAAHSDLERLEREIEHEAVLGQLRGDIAREKQALQAEYEAHLEMLNEIARSPTEFDFAAHIAEASARADEMLATAAGDIARLHAEAVVYRWQQELPMRAQWEVWDQRNRAFEASPTLFREDLWQEAWSDVLPYVFKYVLGVDRERVDWLDLTKGASGLGGITQQPTGQ